MALLAVNRGMRPFQFIFCKVVVELLFIKPNHIKFPPVMFTVTGETVFRCYFSAGMVSFFLTDERFDLFMAIQAFIIVHFLTQIMALRTIAHPFQVSMRLRQVARG